MKPRGPLSRRKSGPIHPLFEPSERQTPAFQDVIQLASPANGCENPENFLISAGRCPEKIQLAVVNGCFRTPAVLAKRQILNTVFPSGNWVTASFAGEAFDLVCRHEHLVSFWCCGVARVGP